MPWSCNYNERTRCQHAGQFQQQAFVACAQEGCFIVNISSYVALQQAEADLLVKKPDPFLNFPPLGPSNVTKKVFIVISYRVLKGVLNI